MRPEDRDSASLWDMLEAARAVVRILGECTAGEFTGESGDVVRSAVERTLEVLGEAARRMSEGFQERHPEVPWKDLVGLRNVISHQYEKVDYGEIYRICRERIPMLVEQLSPLVPPAPDVREL